MDNEKQNSIIRVLIVDDDPFVRTSLSTILEAQDDDIEICAMGSQGEEAIKLFEDHMPDVLLMDIQMPQKNGLDAASSILNKHPDARIVFLTTFSDDDYIVSALRMGSKGYLIKQEVAHIAPALRSVMAGQTVLGGEVLGRVDALMGTPAKDSGEKEKSRSHVKKLGLSERELEIIELIAQGLDNKEIAGKIFIGEGTVRNHVSAILQKLELKNRTQLAVYFYRNFL